MLLDFVKSTIKRDEQISAHINGWLDRQRRIDENGGFDKASMEVVLFLLSLGPKYRMFVNLACMYTQDQFTLRNVMAKARDFKFSENEDEAGNSAIALSAHGTTKITTATRTYDKPKCSACGNNYHTYETCFDGGLSHLDKEGRRRYLDEKRRQREERRGDYGQARDRDHDRNRYRGGAGRDSKRSRYRSPSPPRESAHAALQRDNLQLKIQAAKDKLEREGITIDLGL